MAEALARRGLGGQQAPMMQEGGAPPAPAPQMGAPTSQPAPQAPQGKPEFVPKTGTEYILTTLNEQLKNDHKLESERLKMNAPAMV